MYMYMFAILHLVDSVLILISPSHFTHPCMVTVQLYMIVLYICSRYYRVVQTIVSHL